MKTCIVLCAILLNIFSLIFCSDIVNQNSTAPPVGITLIHSAGAKGAVCLDGTLPAYHLDRGFGSGSNSWLIDLEGGGWCNDIRSCLIRKTTYHGSSDFMERTLQFTGILSNKHEENPDFYNWNRVRLRYCDGASFSGEGSNEAASLQFRGQRIWSAAMEELNLKGMKYANQALLSGCSAGGLASILHCDQFRALFPESTRVKCIADAGFFIDAVDIAGGRTLRAFYEGVVTLQGVSQNLPEYCKSKMNATLCFFPQNLLGNIKTPLFLLNSAYDTWQIYESLAPSIIDPKGYWNACKSNYIHCNATQLHFLQDFRKEMLNSMKEFSLAKKNGMFINSCFTHCQSEGQDTWFGPSTPSIDNKGIGKSVGDWFFDRRVVKEIDKPYPCDQTCGNKAI